MQKNFAENKVMINTLLLHLHCPLHFETDLKIGSCQKDKVIKTLMLCIFALHLKVDLCQKNKQLLFDAQTNVRILTGQSKITNCDK